MKAKPGSLDCPFRKEEDAAFAVMRLARMALLRDPSPATRAADQAATAAWNEATKRRVAAWKAEGWKSLNERLLEAVFGQ